MCIRDSEERTVARWSPGPGGREAATRERVVPADDADAVVLADRVAVVLLAGRDVAVVRRGRGRVGGVRVERIEGVIVVHAHAERAVLDDHLLEEVVVVKAGAAGQHDHALHVLAGGTGPVSYTHL